LFSLLEISVSDFPIPVYESPGTVRIAGQVGASAPQSLTSDESEAHQISSGSQLRQHVSHVRLGRLQVFRQVSIPGETRLIIPTQAVDFGDQKLLGW
jgi:hypothetical protein